jgi:CheY-like chemotaxis protein
VNATILRNEGYEVLACSDPLQAVSIAESEDLDVAILDYEMPVMNGAQLAACCKAANPATKVIFFSGCLTIPRRELALADLFVEKSHGVELLLDAIASLLIEKERAKCASKSYDNNEATQQ